MAKRSFDELNSIGISIRNIEIRKQVREYFEETEMSTEQTERRIALALALIFVFRRLFKKSIDLLNEAIINIDEIVESVAQEYKNAMEESELEDFDDEFDEHIQKSIKQITETTLDKLKKLKDKEKTVDKNNVADKDIAKNYIVSDARAVVLAETEAHSAWSAKELSDAIKEGNKWKTWITMRDKKVRESHTIADKTTIGIYDTFTIGDSELGYPGDITYGPEPSEIVNCRCHLRFSK